MIIKVLTNCIVFSPKVEDIIQSQVNMIHITGIFLTIAKFRDSKKTPSST